MEVQGVVDISSESVTITSSTANYNLKESSSLKHEKSEYPLTHSLVHV